MVRTIDSCYICLQARLVTLFASQELDTDLESMQRRMHDLVQIVPDFGKPCLRAASLLYVCLALESSSSCAQMTALDALQVATDFAVLLQTLHTVLCHAHAALRHEKDLLLIALLLLLCSMLLLMLLLVLLLLRMLLLLLLLLPLVMLLLLMLQVRRCIT